ncbi:hypothetical protein BH10PLA2_BH10PLA2_08980 [soil metagenome]
MCESRTAVSSLSTAPQIGETHDWDFEMLKSVVDRKRNFLAMLCTEK